MAGGTSPISPQYYSAAPEFTVLAGQEEIGTVGDDVLLCDNGDGPRVLLLAGLAWLVTHVDWKRRRCFVELTDLLGKTRWSTFGGGLSFDITRGMRDVLLGQDPVGVQLTSRASRAMGELREHYVSSVCDGRTVLQRSSTGDLLWWTWAGTAANRTLHASLPALMDPHQRFGTARCECGGSVILATSQMLCEPSTLTDPTVHDGALAGLKFASALPVELARGTLAIRFADRPSAIRAFMEDRTITH